MDAPAAFEWDAAKADANFTKHGVRFEVAKTVFHESHCIVIGTARIEDGEERRKAIGVIAGRLFTTVFVMRGTICRIISARRSNGSEERIYDR